MTFETAIISLLALFGFFVIVYSYIITEFLISSNKELKYEKKRTDYWARKSTLLENKLTQKEILSEMDIPEMSKV